ncbi:MAG: DUF6427 family protein [Cytophagales bacterium]|nr:DUF6427 family protein [Cytophagales bacterium]MDW8383797.1 DUF6427 family protein [Flammeovirgaceae bacterium]
MLKFFRINDPFRVIYIALLLLVFRLPFWLSENRLTVAELSWLTLAEKLNSGAVMYADIWDKTPLLAAWCYQISELLFGKTIIPLHFIALILILHQAYVFNKFLIDFNILNEKTYVPAYLYVVFINFSFDNLIFSPALCSLSFLILVLRNILRPEHKTVEQDIFKSGFYLGIATLFYFPSISFAILTLIGYIFFRTSSLKTLLNILYGFSTIIISFFTYLYYYDILDNFFTLFWYEISPNTWITKSEISWLLAISVFWGLAGLFASVYESNKFINYQNRCRQFMVLWAITAILNLLFIQQLQPNDAIFLVPSLAFLTTNLLLLIRKFLLAEVLSWVVTFSVLLVNYNTLHGYFKDWDKVDYSKMLVQTRQFPFQNKKVLVLGDTKDYYLNNQLATPYFQWEFASKHFQSLDNYSILIEIQKNFEKDFPEIIVDEKKIVQHLFKKIPAIASYYQQDKTNPIIYRKKDI